jgi:signal peptidase I
VNGDLAESENMKGKEVFFVVIVLVASVFLINVLTPFTEGLEKPLVVLSGSMTPIMLPGDIIIVKLVDQSELEVGDVIAFQPPGSRPGILVTHRIISLEEGKERLIQTKGDANNEKDAFKIPTSKAFGKLVFVIPFLGYLTEFSKYKIFFIIMIIIPACLLITDEIKNIFKYSNTLRTQKIEKQQKKLVWRTSYTFKMKSLFTFTLISGLFFISIIMYNIGSNGPIILEKENTVKNSGFLPLVYVFTPEDLKQRFALNSWYGVVSPANDTKVFAPENMHVKISSVPYVLPVFWIISLATVNPYLPASAIIVVYTSLFILLFYPLWFRKSVIQRRKKRNRFRRLLAKWKRTLITVNS